MPSGEFFTDYEKQTGLVRWRIEWVALLVGLPLVFALPLFLGGSGISTISFIFIMAVAVLGLNVTVGYSGELVLAHGATIAIGAYAATPIILGAGLSLIPGCSSAACSREWSRSPSASRRIA